MKKILISFLILIFSFTSVFAYTPTQKDYNLLNKIYPKLNFICKKSKKNCKNLKNKIDKISFKYKKNEKIYFLLNEISKFLSKKLEKNKKNFQNTKKIKTKNLNSTIIVTKVIDWDTIHFKKSWKDYVARLIWIDSPENSTTRYGHTEKLWKEAKIYLSNLILNKKIKIEYDKTQARTDKYWRHLVYIFYNWENINKKMIEEGLAKEYTYNKAYKYQKIFLQAQKLAKKYKKWIWSFKKEDSKKIIKHISNHYDIAPKNCKIKWNINSKWEKIYHLPWCRSYNKTKISPYKWEKYFCSEKQALQAWWRKAWNCY